MRLVSLLAIITALAGCPVAIDIPDGSLPDMHQNVAGRVAENDDRGTTPTSAGSNAGPRAGSGGADRPYEGGGYDGGVPNFPDGGTSGPRDPNMLDPRTAPAHIRVMVMGEPTPQLPVQALWVNVLGVEAHVWVDGGERWLPVPGMPLHLDLLSLRDGKRALLGDARVPPGKYDRLRVHIGREARAIVDGVEHPLPVAPEFGTQGVLVEFGTEIRGGVSYEIAIAFDVLASLQQRENGPVLAPFIHVKEVSMSGGGQAPQPEQPMRDGGTDLPPPPAPDGGMEAERPDAS